MFLLVIIMCMWSSEYNWRVKQTLLVRLSPRCVSIDFQFHCDCRLTRYRIFLNVFDVIHVVFFNARSLSLSLSLSHSLTLSLTHSPTHSFTHPLTHSLTHSPTHPPTHPLTHSLTEYELSGDSAWAALSVCKEDDPLQTGDDGRGGTGTI